MLLVPSLSFTQEVSGINQKVDQFFTTYLGWFASTIFYGVKIEEGSHFH